MVDQRNTMPSDRVRVMVNLALVLPLTLSRAFQAAFGVWLQDSESSDGMLLSRRQRNPAVNDAPLEMRRRIARERSPNGSEVNSGELLLSVSP